MDPQTQTMIFYLLFIPHMLFALSAHEAAHAGSAFLLGDDTAVHLGRLTLNPFRHLDPFGLIAFFIIHFGWAKPVPVNPLRLRNPKADMLLIGLAGPMSNLFLGVLLLLVLRLLWSVVGPASQGVEMLLAFLFVGAQLNVGLCFFNLLPVPPLDGGHVLLGLLPDAISRQLETVLTSNWLMTLALLLLVFFLGGVLIYLPMSFVIQGLLGKEIALEMSRIFAAYNFR